MTVTVSEQGLEEVGESISSVLATSEVAVLDPGDAGESGSDVLAREVEVILERRLETEEHLPGFWHFPVCFFSTFL